MKTFDISKADVQICKLSQRRRFCSLSKSGRRWAREHFLIGTGVYERDDGQGMIQGGYDRWREGSAVSHWGTGWRGVLSRLGTYEREVQRVNFLQAPLPAWRKGRGCRRKRIGLGTMRA